MSSGAENNPSVCPKCGSKLDTYNGDGRECTNDDCRWIDPLGGGRTVGGSASHDGGVETDTWPSELPRDIYQGEKQRRVIETAVRNPGVTEYQDLAEIADCSRSTVGKAMNKARVFVAPGETTLPVPEEPSYKTVVGNVIDHGRARFGRADFALFDEDADDPVSLKAIRDREIESIRARALAGESPSKIAEDYDADRKTVYDRVVGRAGNDSNSSIPGLIHDDGEYVLPDSQGGDNADTLPVCPSCPVYWESVPDSWGVCPRCGTGLIEAESAEVPADE